MFIGGDPSRGFGAIYGENRAFCRAYHRHRLSGFHRERNQRGDILEDSKKHYKAHQKKLKALKLNLKNIIIKLYIILFVFFYLLA